MIVNLSFKNGDQKIFPLVDDFQIKEYHIVITTDHGVELELRCNIDKIRIIGV